MSIYGDFWIYPDGTAQDMGQMEHAEVALKAMMKLPQDEYIPRKSIFEGLKAFTKDQIAEAKRAGASKQAFDFLRKGGDPRLYAMKVWNWIRVARTRMQMWDFDDATLEIIQKSDYWNQQPQLEPYDTFDIEELSTHETFSLSVKKLRNRSAEAGALKRFATGVGQFHENPGLEDDMHRYMYEINGEMKLFQPRGGWEEIEGDGIARNPPPSDAKIRGILKSREGAKGSQSARIYVGLWTDEHAEAPTLGLPDGRLFRASPAGYPGNYAWSEDAVIALVWSLRTAQVRQAFKEGYAKPHPLGGDVGASFILQRGLWQKAKDDRDKPEPSMQIIMLNTIQEDAYSFEQDMKQITSELAVQLIQWGVVAEFYESGRMREVLVYDGRTERA